ncbi:MAG: site-specific integrase [Proteobacteria bacterium]|nr:site-specific integrase [Pseudomonadota bacterium]
MFRDGLMIALLALRPLRRANFCETEIGRNLVRHGDGYRLTFDITEPKTEYRIELPFPAAHLVQLERYLTFYRPWLCRLTGHRNPAYPFREPGNCLWISKTGSALSVEGFYKNIRNLTEAKFGFNVNPHLFRDCLATSVAIHDPEHVGITRVLLGHKTSTTAERYYNLAGSVQASGRVQACIGEIRGRLRNGSEGDASS